MDWWSNRPERVRVVSIVTEDGAQDALVVLSNGWRVLTGRETATHHEELAGLLWRAYGLVLIERKRPSVIRRAITAIARILGLASPMAW